VAGAPSRKFEDRILAAIEKAVVARKLLPFSTNSKRTLFLQLQKLFSEELRFTDDAWRWPDSPEKRQEAARSRVVKGPVEEADPVDRLTLQGIHNEQQFRAVLSSGNDAATIDFIGRDATGELLFRAFRVTIEVYFTTTWSKAPDPQCEDFDKSVGIIKSRVIAECRKLWRGRLFAPSDMNPPAAGKELPWFDRMPLADVRTALEDEANRWSKQAREFELGRRKEAESDCWESDRGAEHTQATDVGGR